ncbi:hypothetical protein E2C01_095667 [Portunus trituberculatus]|uniref:Uncharacterized protein n=1 Tax=Portunus trituberculatus TaxID=210409 RepID=A0A5B7K4T3_PORTR|nr:hypothetical protein [Portunus trituberculatus]
MLASFYNAPNIFFSHSSTLNLLFNSPSFTTSLFTGPQVPPAGPGRLVAPASSIPVWGAATHTPPPSGNHRPAPLAVARYIT